VTTDARSRERAGASVIEAVVALLVGLLVLQLGLSTLAHFRATQRELVERADALVTLRIGRHVLRRELRHGVPGRDWLVEGDSLSLRAFRGAAAVCVNDTVAAQLVVSYRGDRAPDPSKDSVLLLGGDGASVPRALVGAGVSPSPCVFGPADGVTQRWTLDQPAPTGTVAVKIFERGSYHLGGAALRYRRGASGRQPLTPEVLAAATTWDLAGGRIGVELVPSRAGVAWSGFLAWLSTE
jgi:hypothetical protein